MYNIHTYSCRLMWDNVELHVDKCVIPEVIISSRRYVIQ